MRIDGIMTRGTWGARHAHHAHHARRAACALVLFGAAACANLGSLGNVLGGVLGGGNQLQGVVRGVDTRAQQVYVQQGDGSTVTLRYDAQTQVVYQNQNYGITSLERGDQVTPRVQSDNNGGYYTDLVQVDQPVQGSGSVYGTSNGGQNGGQNVQSLSGTVRQVDRSNGWFAVDVGNGSTLTVTLPYNPGRNEVARFQALRNGDYVRFYGVYVNQGRVELRSFY